MTWLDVLLLYIAVIETVINTARVWGPLLIATAGLALALRCCRKAGRYRRGHGPEVSGHDPGSPGEGAE